MEEEQDKVRPALPFGTTVPPRMRIEISANLAGVVVALSGEPNSYDPLGQTREEYFYPTLEEALSNLRDVAAMRLQTLSYSLSGQRP